MTRSRRRLRATGIAAATFVLVLAAAWFVGRAPAGQSPLARLGTEDVHALAFVGDDPEHLLFGHHGGILESVDGGRSWQPLPTQADAMAMAPASDGSIVIAGHEVFTASRDGGVSWQDIPTDLPSLDIHGFARDPADPGRMWALLATGGLWESRDGGVRWEQVRSDNILFPVATTDDGRAQLYGLDVSGLATSIDGGRTWAPLATPPAYPITSFTATADGGTLLIGAPDGIYRSDDRGGSWRKLPFIGSAFAVAMSAGGREIAVVTKETQFFRSHDGGETWPGSGAVP